ncbi:MAG: hypothetical protein AABZ10_09690 [Nitrospirota bacterium]
MNTFLQNLLLGVTRPKKLYSMLSEKSNLNNAIWIALAIGIVHVLQLIHDQTLASFFQKLKHPSLLGMVLYAVIAGLLYFLQTGFQVLLNVVCIKIVFYFLHIKSNIRVLVTVLTFTLLPLLIRESIRALWTDYEGALGFGGQYKISYYKTSLAQLVANSNFTHKIGFYLLSEFDIFTIWSFILGAIAVAVVGKVSYKISSSIMLFSWIVSSIVFLIST